MITGLINQKLRDKEDNIRLHLEKHVEERLRGEVDFTESILREQRTAFYAETYARISDCAIFEKGVHPTEASVFYNIDCVKRLHEKMDYEARFCGYAYLDQKKQGRKVHLCALDSSGPEMSLDMIEQVLTHLELNKWTLDTLKQKIPDECKSAINCEESCPEIEAGYQDVIKAFEV
jgi:hypothetical protein